jgi:serine/threonine protein kinase
VIANYAVLRACRSIAAPELIDGIDIGIEADMYSLGIVMWEVFTRREAWHWLKNLDRAQHKIAFQAAVNGMRPKCPSGLSDHCALMVRRLLHADLSKRPSAKDVTRWLQQHIHALQKYTEDERAFQASEREARGAMTNKRKVLDIQKRHVTFVLAFSPRSFAPYTSLQLAASAQGSWRGCRVVQKVQGCC